MREIKFRGKCLDGGEWVYGDYHHRVGGVHCIIDIQPDSQGKVVYVVIQVDADTVGQFTGLSDYDRAEIFEGDIVKYSYTHPVDIGSFDGPKEQEETVIGAVEYRNGCFFIGVYDIGSFDIDGMEIIGNIHDNPELLETE